MDKKQMLAEHLYRAERHIAQGEHHIQRQQQIIHDLECGGHELQRQRRC